MLPALCSMLCRRRAAIEQSFSNRLSSGDRPSYSSLPAPSHCAGSALGYIEGQNFVIEYRFAEGKQDRTPELAAELVRLKVDVIVVPGAGRNGRGGQERDQDDSRRHDGPVGSIQSRQASLKALLGPAATSPALQTLPVN